MPKKYNRFRACSFINCESLISGFGTENGVAKWRKAIFCKENVPRKHIPKQVSRVVFKMASNYESDLDILPAVKLPNTRPRSH